MEKNVATAKPTDSVSLPSTTMRVAGMALPDEGAAGLLPLHADSTVRPAATTAKTLDADAGSKRVQSSRPPACP
jgi:hypothetical protein